MAAYPRPGSKTGRFAPGPEAAIRDGVPGGPLWVIRLRSAASSVMAATFETLSQLLPLRQSPSVVASRSGADDALAIEQYAREQDRKFPEENSGRTSTPASTEAMKRYHIDISALM